MEVTLSRKYNRLVYFSCFQGNMFFSPRANSRGYSSALIATLYTNLSSLGDGCSEV